MNMNIHDLYDFVKLPQLEHEGRRFAHPILSIGEMSDRIIVGCSEHAPW
jgi:hypothetical protein